MSEPWESKDAVLLTYDSPVALDGSFWLAVRESLMRRLGVQVWLIDCSIDVDELGIVFETRWKQCLEAGIQRLSVISIESAIRTLSYLQIARAIEPEPNTQKIYMAPPWNAADWAEYLDGRASQLARPRILLFVEPTPEGTESYGHSTESIPVFEIVWELRKRRVAADYLVEYLSEPVEIGRPSQAEVLSVLWGKRTRVGADDPSSSSAGLRISDASLWFDSESYASILIGKYLAGFQQSELRFTDRRMENNSFREFETRMNDLLPNEYRGRTDEVSPNSMGSASLFVDDTGRVPWDKIWTSFCDLALAGGPPHRGKLLEAVTREEVGNQFEDYLVVVAEIRRGVELVTGMPTFESEVPGWVGIRCQNEAMAIWMMRAIITENVMVRREGCNLFVPAGPGFQIKREIKNVITSVAKTHHYWLHHRAKK